MPNTFLNKLKKEKKLELVEPSEDICTSYTEKSTNCLKSAKLLLQNDLLENSIGMSYYAMYNALLALLFRTGVKCENHTGSLLLLKELYNNDTLYNILSDAKKERIDKQYYVTTEKDDVTKEATHDLFNKAEDFTLQMNVIIAHLNNDSIEALRSKFETL